MVIDDLQNRLNDVTEQQLFDALRAVVELHKPIMVVDYDTSNNLERADYLQCGECSTGVYPCPTIEAIEKEVNK
jgi:hypothetical protein